MLFFKNSNYEHRHASSSRNPHRKQFDHFLQFHELSCVCFVGFGVAGGSANRTGLFCVLECVVSAQSARVEETERRERFLLLYFQIGIIGYHSMEGKSDVELPQLEQCTIHPSSLQHLSTKQIDSDISI